MNFEEKVLRAYNYARNNSYRFYQDQQKRRELEQNSIITFIKDKEKINSLNIEEKAIDSWMYTIMRREKLGNFDMRKKSTQQDRIFENSPLVDGTTEEYDSDELFEIESDINLENILSCKMLRSFLWRVYKANPKKAYKVFYYRMIGYKSKEVAKMLNTTDGSIRELYRLSKLELSAILKDRN